MSEKFINFCQAIRKGNLEKIKLLLSQEENTPGHLLMERDPHTCRSALFSVLWVGDSSEVKIAILKLLLDHGADLRVQDSAGFTVLHYSQDINILRFLLFHHNHQETTKLLLLEETHLGRIPLHCAAKDCVAQLLVECEFEEAMLNAHRPNGNVMPSSFFTTLPSQILRARDTDGLTPLQYTRNEVKALQDLFKTKTGFVPPAVEKYFIKPRRNVIEYLDCWESAVTFHWKDVAKKKTLSKFQAFLISQLLELLSRSAIEEVSFIILGYLAPIDLLNSWDSWIERKMPD